MEGIGRGGSSSLSPSPPPPRAVIDEQSWNAQCSAPTTTGLVQKEYNPLAAQRKECEGLRPAPHV